MWVSNFTVSRSLQAYHGIDFLMTWNQAHPLWRDSIVAEVRRVRDDLAAAAGRDIHEFCRRLRERQVKSGHPVVTRAPHAKLDGPGWAV